MDAFIHPATAPLRGIVDPPSSKNYTTRYILASCLAAGRSVVHRPAVQDDAVALVGCCRRLGATIRCLDAAGGEVPFDVAHADAIDRLEIEGFGGTPRVADPSTPIDPENAGAVLRLLIGTGALVQGGVAFDTARHRGSLGKRPNKDLLDALAHLGVEAVGANADGALPVRLNGGRVRMAAHLAARRRDEGIAPGDPIPVDVSGAVSSQFVSSLLFLAPLVGEDIEVVITGDMKSAPLIATTCAVLADAGIRVESTADARRHRVRAGQSFRAREWHVNGDWPGSAAILTAAVAVPGSQIGVRRLRDDEQGERLCADFYAAMGCRVEKSEDGGVTLVTIASPTDEPPHAATIDGDRCTDGVLAMMAAAALARGTSRFDGIANLQFKECDRVRQPIAEMIKVAATNGREHRIGWWEPTTDPSTIVINGSPDGFEGGITVDGCGDHRVIMLLSILGLRCRRGLTIRGAEHVAKSFPGWFETLRRLGAQVDLLGKPHEDATP